MATEATVLIVNPNARGGWLGRRWPTLEPLLREELGPLTVRFTSRGGEGADLCEEALQGGAELVIAVGGDGTASEVAGGFLRRHEAGQGGGAVFGFLPAGTGGDIGRTYGSPRELRAAAQALLRARPREIDAGRIDFLRHDGRPGTTYFINIAGFGVGGLLDQLVSRTSRRLGATAAYFSAALRATLRYRNARVRMRLDDDPPWEGRVYHVAIANGRYFGSGMQVAPMALPDDGIFDVVTLGDLSLLQAVGLSGTIYRGKHVTDPKNSTARARRVYAEPVDEGEAVLLEVDGEAPGRLPATFTVLPKALRLRA